MPLVDSVKSFFRKAEVPIINDGRGNLPEVTVWPGLGLPGARWSQWAYDAFAREGYCRNSDVYACISLIATSAKQVKFWDGKDEKKAGWSREDRVKSVCDISRWPAAVRDVPGDYARKLEETARMLNPAKSIALLTKAGGPQFIEQWISYLLLAGNTWIEIDRAAGREPAMLWLDRPDRVGLPPGIQPPRGRPSLWRVRRAYTATTYDVPAEDMVHSKLFNPLDDVFGMPPITAAMMTVDSQNEAVELFKRIMQRGYVPGWIEAAKDSDWTDEQVAKLKERMAGSKRAGEELFLENATWHQMGFPPVESGATENHILSKRDIASVFHVPSVLIGDATAATYSNYREARRSLYMEAVIPPLVQFRDDWNRTIGRELNSPLEFDRDSFDAITAAREEAADRVSKLWSIGLITQNEGRADLEYSPVDGGDVFYAPANMLPLGSAEAASEAAEAEEPKR